MLRIDPTNMTDDERYALGFFLGFFSENTFPSNVYYSFPLPHRRSQFTTIKIVSFKYPLVKRSCKSGGKHDGQFRYEIIEHGSLGEGSFAKVYQTLGVIIPALNQDDLPTFKSKIRIGKFLSFTKTKNAKKSIELEYSLTPPHMHMRPPSFIDDGCFLFMDFIEGINLQDLLDITNGDQRFRHFLDAGKCISLCISLADALDSQVHAHEIVHRDLKPDNIIIKYDQENQTWKVTIIDFGLSKKKETNDKDIGFGTPLYASPESFQGRGTTAFSDIYALAAIFSEIFGCNRALFITRMTQLYDEWFHGNLFLNGIFENIPGIDQFPKEDIKTFIETMSTYECIFRPNAKKTAERFKRFLFFQPRLTSASQPANDDNPQPTSVNPSKQ